MDSFRTEPSCYCSSMPPPAGFAYRLRGQSVVISHRGRPAATLRGDAAASFLAAMKDAGEAEAQEIMARATGNYRRGNERTARQHPRNR